MSDFLAEAVQALLAPFRIPAWRVGLVVLAAALVALGVAMAGFAAFAALEGALGAPAAALATALGAFALGGLAVFVGLRRGGTRVVAPQPARAVQATAPPQPDLAASAVEAAEAATILADRLRTLWHGNPSAIALLTVAVGVVAGHPGLRRALFGQDPPG